jgi:hypothetical protein
LPKNLSIASSLYLTNTNITELPENLIVMNTLYLKNIPINKLSNNMYIDKEINVQVKQSFGNDVTIFIESIKFKKN